MEKYYKLRKQTYKWVSPKWSAEDEEDTSDDDAAAE